MKSFLKTFLIIFFPIICVFILSFHFIDKVIEKNLKKEILNGMRIKWQLLRQYNYNQTFNIETYKKIREISEETSLRITVVKKNGTVVYDSFLPAKEILKMENHRNRPEIKQALFGKKKEGYSVRYSHTLHINMFYYAKVYNDNIILRIAYPLTFIEKFKSSYIDEVSKTYIYLTIIVLFIAIILAMTISSPISKLEYLSEQIEKGKQNILFPEFKDAAFRRISNVVYKIYLSMKKQKEDIIREKEKFQSIFEILEEGLILLTFDNNILSFNGRAVELLNIKLQKNINIFNLKNLDHNLINFLNVINEKEGSYRMFLYNKTFSVYLKILENEKLFMFYDITKDVEYTEFKHQLIGNITHELKTPIATIMNYSETIMEVEDIDRENIKHFIRIIYKNTKRMNELIHDIMELHKLENIKSMEVYEKTNINEIMSELLETYKEDDKKIIVNKNVDTLNMLVQHFSSLLRNLIDNAVKYSDGKNIYVNIEEKNNKIKILVKDEGPVIPPEKRERIFERFYTVSESRNKKHGGSGLGLSIVKHITKLYNGTVKLHPNNINGNTFEIEIPNS